MKNWDNRNSRITRLNIGFLIYVEMSKCVKKKKLLLQMIMIVVLIVKHSAILASLQNSGLYFQTWPVARVFEIKSIEYNMPPSPPT